MNFQEVAKLKQKTEYYFVSDKDGTELLYSEYWWPNDEECLEYASNFLGPYHVVRRYTQEVLFTAEANPFKESHDDAGIGFTKI